MFAYLVHTLRDINNIVGFVSRFMWKPIVEHLIMFKHIMRYLERTVWFGH